MGKKILLISFEYPVRKRYCGGVGQIVKQCRDALKDLGHEVYVLISAEFFKKYPVRVLLPNDSFITYSNFSGFNREHNWVTFDYIIQHFVNWAKELEQIKRTKGKRPKIIYHFHSILRREKDSGFNTLNRFLLNQERMIALADTVICPSEYEYNNFIRYFPYFGEKVFLVENTIETFPRHESDITYIKNKYRIRKNNIVSTYVGRLERIKGAHILINNIPEILKKYKNKKIFIIGKVLERSLYYKLKLIQKKFPQQLFYLPYLEKRLLYQYYYLSDIYVNTSLSESFSLSTHESAFCKNALLLSQLPVFNKFKDVAIFFSSHNNNGDDFVSRYEKLIQDVALREKLSNNSIRVAQDFIAQGKLREQLSTLLSTTPQ